MIRANLLPRAKETISAFGLELDLDHVRQALAGVGLALLVGGAGVGIERFRIDRLDDELASQRRAIAARAPERAAAKGLASDVARYEEFARTAAAFRRSGGSAAIDVANVGNALPRTVWLDSIDRDAAGFSLSGESTSLDAIGTTLSRLAVAAPPSHAEIVSIDAHASDRSAIRFNVRLAVPAVEDSSL